MGGHAISATTSYAYDDPRRKTVHYARTSADVRRRWPELVTDNEPYDFSGVN